MHCQIVVILLLAFVAFSYSESKFDFKNNKSSNDTSKNQLTGDHVELIKYEIKKYLIECGNGGGGGDFSDENTDSERYPRRGFQNNRDDYNSDGYDGNSRNFGHNKRQSFGSQSGGRGSSRGGSESSHGGSGSSHGGSGSSRGGSGGSHGGGGDRFGEGSDRNRGYGYGGGGGGGGGGDSDRGYGGGYDYDGGYGGGSDHGQRYGGGRNREESGAGNDDNYGRGNSGRGRNSGRSNGGSYGGYDSYGENMGGGGSRRGGYGQSSYGGYIRSKRSENSAQCISQCVFGYFEVLDDNRSPSESALLKWVHDNMQNDAKRIKAIREIRRCFARLASADKNDGCTFSKSLSNCMNLEIEN